MDDGSRVGAPATLANGREDGRAPEIAPLTVSGLVVTRHDLVAALRLWLPQLVDVEVLEHSRFVLRLAEAVPGPHENGIGERDGHSL